jgi:hypothetical protein
MACFSFLSVFPRLQRTQLHTRSLDERHALHFQKKKPDVGADVLVQFVRLFARRNPNRTKKSFTNLRAELAPVIEKCSDVYLLFARTPAAWNLSLVVKSFGVINESALS